MKQLQWMVLICTDWVYGGMQALENVGKKMQMENITKISIKSRRKHKKKIVKVEKTRQLQHWQPKNSPHNIPHD